MAPSSLALFHIPSRHSRLPQAAFGQLRPRVLPARPRSALSKKKVIDMCGEQATENLERQPNFPTTDLLSGRDELVEFPDLSFVFRHVPGR